MKTRSKIGNRKGNPAYRTPSVFRSNKNIEIAAQRSKQCDKYHSDCKRLAKKPD